MYSDLLRLRKDIHQHPEISGFEKKTAERIRQELQKCNPDEIHANIGGHGVLACFKSCENNPAKKILFRAELDAISVQEETGMAYQSKNKNAMHACGHDGHMAILIGLAKKFRDKRPENLDAYLFFQPAEETGEGAAKVLKDKRFRNLEIDRGFALHNLPGFPEHSVVSKEGTFAAGSVGIKVTIKGSSSHAAHPEQGINPAVAVAQLIRKIDREMEPFRSRNRGNKLVCTFIKMGEKAFGISPGNAELGFTIRSESDRELAGGVQRIHKVIKNVAETFGGEINTREVEPFRATVNDPAGPAIIKKVSELQGLNYQQLERPFAWSEDFGEFREHFPITIFGLGAGRDKPPLHSEKFDFNDELISSGVSMFTGIVDYYETL